MAGVGLAAGAGLYSAAVATTVIILVILAGLKPLEDRYHASRTNLELQIKARRGGLSLGSLETRLAGARPGSSASSCAPPNRVRKTMSALLLTRVSAADTADIIRRLEAVDGVLKIDEARI